MASVRLNIQQLNSKKKFKIIIIGFTVLAKLSGSVNIKYVMLSEFVTESAAG